MSKGFDDLLSKVSQCSKKKVSVAVAQDGPVLEAVEEARKRGIADAILVGDEAEIKKIADGLGIDLANFEEMKSFSQFGSDLDSSTVKVIKHGEALLQILKQGQYQPYSLDKEIIYLFAAKNRYLDDIEISKINSVMSDLYNYLKTSHKALLDKINKDKAIDDKLDGELKSAIKKYFEMYK